MPYTVIVNQPGTLPETDPTEHASLTEAIDHLVFELEVSRNVCEPGDSDYEEYQTLIERTRCLHEQPETTSVVIGPCPMRYVYEIRKEG